MMMTKNLTNDLNFLRSILNSNDAIQISSSGDYYQISLKLNDDFQIKFFINPSIESLILNNLHDLHIYKQSNKNSFKLEQWKNIQDYFNQILQQSNSHTSIYSIIQSIQEYLLQNNSKLINNTNENLSITITNENASTRIEKFRGADLIYNRIMYDTNIDRSKVFIGYEDRFTGIHEILFNEFKKVHEDQYGIPMHRIRYYKINQQIVWDRNKKFDILTGCESIENFELKQNLTEGLYHFDSSINQWILCSNIPTIEFDNIEIPSIDHMCIPKRCQFITWNIFSDLNQYTNERYREILKTLKTFLPDLICLQEVTKDFLNLLLNEIWLKNNNYYIIIMENINQSYGQIMLMKNFRPRSFNIDSFDSIDNKYIIARFGLNSHITIDLINLHLINFNEKSFENFLQLMNIKNYLLIGDFNFGDDDLIEENIIQKIKYQIHDLWKDIYDLEQNPGYTFDLKRNNLAQLNSNTQISRRSDRYLFHKLLNLSYSIEHLNMIGLETIKINNNKYINQSNHFGLQLIINFHIRLMNNDSALVILPKNIQSLLLSNQELIYINLFHPFFNLNNTEDDEENILLPLRLLFVQYDVFNIEFDDSMKLSQQSIKYVKELHEKIKKLFSQCIFNNEINLNLSITNEKSTSIETIRYVYILKKTINNDKISFNITHQIPLGSVLEPIGLYKCNYISNELEDLFKKMNLYQNEKFFKQKQENFHKLLNFFKNFFTKDILNYYTYTFLPYGSYRLGLHGDDLDTVFILSEEKNNQKKTKLDEILFQLKNNSLELNNYLINLLKTEILNNLKYEINECRIIQAIYPIISIIFNNEIRVEIFVQLIFNEENINLISNIHQPIHGVHDIERLITYVRFPNIFQYLLTFIRIWAQHIGLYGQVYGYLGGYSWAILCAFICHKYLPSNLIIFSIKEFFILIEHFFITYSNFNWSYESLCLYSNHFSIDNRGSMRILCPSPPYNNTARSTINSTRYLIIQSFKNVCKINFENILQISKQFPDQTIQSILQLTLSSETINELNQWIGYMKSRLGHFLNDCENECNLFIQTDTNIEIRKISLERYYSIGFQLNANILSYNREFYNCLIKFLDQFKIYPYRTKSMKMSYKLMSINDWNMERMNI